MSYSVTKKIGPVCATHALPRLPESNACRNTHGHNFYMYVSVGADDLTEDGFVIDFADFEPLEQYLRSWSRLKGGLNELFDDRDPTVEHLAGHVADWYGQHIAPTANGRLLSVRIDETELCWAEYRPEPS